MDGWERIVVFGTFVKLTGDLELVGSQRLTDAVNRLTDFLELRNVTVEPMVTNFPIVTTVEATAEVAKSGIVMIVPLEEEVADGSGRRLLLQHKLVRRVALNAGSFSMVCEVFLDPHHNLRQTLERNVGDFLPVRNMNAIWVPALAGEPVTVQYPFALIQPRHILSFAEREELVT